MRFAFWAVIALCLLSFHGVVESRAFERATGIHVPWYDAMWLQLHVNGQAK